MLSLWRIIKSAFQDMARNIGLSFMTILMLVLMLLSVNVLLAVDNVTKEAVRLVKDQVNVSLYFAADAGDKDIGEVRNYISEFPEVIDVKLLTREEVLSSFQNRHKASPEVQQALIELGANPFGPTMIIKTKEPGDYKKIFEAINVPEYEHFIEAKSFDGNEEAISRIQNITNRVERIGFGLSALFAVIAFFIIFNTVRVTISSQKIEISIKRLVGASTWFIRGPYLVESLVFTLVAVGLTIALIYLGLQWVDPYLTVVFPSGFSLTNYYNSYILYVFGIQAIAVLLLTIASSGLAMRRQLKV
jgi:cell division transport system permease protein